MSHETNLRRKFLDDNSRANELYEALARIAFMNTTFVNSSRSIKMLSFDQIIYSKLKPREGGGASRDTSHGNSIVIAYNIKEKSFTWWFEYNEDLFAAKSSGLYSRLVALFKSHNGREDETKSIDIPVTETINE
jgi:hypothetical protein